MSFGLYYQLIRERGSQMLTHQIDEPGLTTHHGFRRQPKGKRAHKVILLTGIMGGGKSTFRRAVATLPGVVTIDADEVAKQVIWKKENFRRLALIFGNTIFRAHDGEERTINFEEVRILFFESVPRQVALAEEFDPEIVEAVRAEITRATSNGAHTIVIENAVGLEKGWHEIFDVDHAICVLCSKTRQMERLLKRNPGSTMNEHETRIRNQWSAQQKATASSLIIVNNGDEDYLIAQAPIILLILTTPPS